MKGIQEKRGARRVAKSLFVKYRFSGGTQWFESESIDMTPRGIKLSGHLRTRSDDLHELRFSVKGQLINCRMLVTNSDGQKPGGYFTNIKNTDALTLGEYLYN